TEPGTPERRDAYLRDITYGTNNEFGFDYLRDNMVVSLEQRVQRGHVFAIVDEVDSVLIDEARTPLIISGPVGNENDEMYFQHSAAVVRLVRRQTEIANTLVADAERDLEPDASDRARRVDVAGGEARAASRGRAGVREQVRAAPHRASAAARVRIVRARRELRRPGRRGPHRRRVHRPYDARATLVRG